jgi:hypothetical protein
MEQSLRITALSRAEGERQPLKRSYAVFQTGDTAQNIALHWYLLLTSFYYCQSLSIADKSQNGSVQAGTLLIPKGILEC